ncbi:MAG TPA: allene oxide cyclase family protein [Dongiaceae bacterium]|nr:allene oxide cyclase family protein [Dongiaceae bacterium]
MTSLRVLRRTGLAVLFALAPLTAQAASSKLDLVERATTDTVTDLGASGDSAGDVLTFANEIYDAKNKAKVGSDQGWCIRVVVGETWECFWTLILEKGQITVEGPFNDKGDSVLAVTGGTGNYVGARGQMMLHARNDKGTEYDFKYQLK